MESRILAISDIHGKKQKLIDLLNKVNYNNKKDRLILLGDYCDRGEDPMGTLFLIDKLVKNGAIALLGNHDSMFKEIIDLNAFEYCLQEKYYTELGAGITINQYLTLTDSEKIKINNIIENLLPYYELGDFIFSHAGVNAAVDLKLNDIDDLIWIREKFYNYKAYENKICIFGHTPTSYLNKDQSLNIWLDDIYKDKIGIDCGACYIGGKLACLDLANIKEYYV